MNMKDKGLLAKPTHDNIIRLAPPLTIKQNDIEKCLDIIHQAIHEI